MERILRAGLRFSCGGLTYLRIASKFCASAPSETSAHTGRRTSLRELFRVPAMCLPRNLVYAINRAHARRQPLWLPPERQHPSGSANRRPFSSKLTALFASWEREHFKRGLTPHHVSLDNSLIRAILAVVDIYASQ